mgnify:FL=1
MDRGDADDRRGAAHMMRLYHTYTYSQSLLIETFKCAHINGYAFSRGSSESAFDERYLFSFEKKVISKFGSSLENHNEQVQNNIGFPQVDAVP